MVKKLTYDEVKARIEYNNKFKLLTKTYINNTRKLFIKCNKGHLFSISLAKWRYICPICLKEKQRRKKRLLMFKRFVKLLRQENYFIISKSSDYIDEHSLITFKCPNGHVYKISWNAWRNGNRCYLCSKVKKYTIDEIKKIIEAENYKFISKNYKNNKAKIVLQCPKGHIWETTFNSWKRGNRCKKCYDLKRGWQLRKDFNEIANSFKENNYEVLSNELDYVNAHSKIKYRCPNGHVNEIQWNSWNNGTRCASCSHIRSRAELELESELKSITINLIIRDRELIKPYELDFILPDYNLAIEYCGLYWHSEKAGKTKFYHVDKLEKCIKNNYRLITIFEDEWLLSREIVLDKLYLLCNNIDRFRRIYARQCDVVSLSTRDARKFCNENHLQGYVNSSIKYGLEFNNELVGVMTFSKPNISKGKYKNCGSNIYELSRLCFKQGVVVVGGASKLLSKFTKDIKTGLIFSYADRRWSDGALYYKLGFKLVSATSPNYYYIIDNKRVHRFKFRKSQLKRLKNYSEDKTEWEIMKSEGYNRVWDCGHLKFERWINGTK